MIAFVFLQNQGQLQAILYLKMSNDLRPLLASIVTNVDRDLSNIPLLDTIKAKSGIKPSLVFLTITIVVVLLAIFEILPDLLTTLFGMLYPAYMSYKAIEKDNEEQKKIWLTYWIVFGMLVTLDDSFGFLLSYIPGFYALRFILFIWMFYPRANNGATVIYIAVKPILQSVKAQIDNFFNSNTKQA